MEKSECEPIAVKDMDKCAIIYRKDPVSFIYVCYHCGLHFTNIDCTLQHIESHFELVQVTIDEKNIKSECNDFENASSNDLNTHTIRDTTDPEIKIKAEEMEIEEDCGGDSLETPNTFDCERCDSVFSSKFSFRSHTLKDHFKQQAIECVKCGKKFKRDVSFKSHLRQHIERGEVDWNCEGDGIRDGIPKSSTIAIKCPEQQQENSGPPIQVEIESEKRRPKTKNKTTQVKSKQKMRQLSKYICHKCSETYSTSNDLNVHLNAHSTDDMLQTIKCKECKTYFRSPFDLRLHVLEIHLSVKKFKCSSCLAEFKKSEKSLLEKHLEIHFANKSTNWTNICHGIGNIGKDATIFEEITTSTESSCELCGDKFYLKSNLNEHKRCMHSENQHKYRCPDCDTGFTKLKCYFAHQLEHRRVGTTVTETDMNVLITSLNSHIEEQFVCNAVESPSNPYKCLLCDTECSNPLEIRHHIQERHVYKMLPKPIKPKRKETSTCNICGMVLQRNSFRNHLKTHTDSKKYPCSFCGKIFSKNYSKTTHERMHTGEKPFQCHQCGKRFYSNSLLGAHKQNHDATTYPCKICGRVFNIPSGYRRHIQIHRKDLSYECTICFKSFNTRAYLHKHMYKHNEKKFQCSVCENKFNTANGLRKHEISKHNL